MLSLEGQPTFYKAAAYSGYHSGFVFKTGLYGVGCVHAPSSPPSTPARPHARTRILSLFLFLLSPSSSPRSHSPQHLGLLPRIPFFSSLTSHAHLAPHTYADTTEIGGPTPGVGLVPAMPTPQHWSPTKVAVLQLPPGCTAATV